MKIKIAVPSKGRISEPSINILEKVLKLLIKILMFYLQEHQIFLNLFKME